MTGKVLIGISGWRYEPWRGVFYPKGLAQHRELEYASRQFPSIEINGTFYSLQYPFCFDAWYDATPPGFLFAIKGSRFITHMKRLRNVERPLANFFASGLFRLQEKMGPFLWQFPPNFRFNADLLEQFFEMLPRDTGAALALARRRDERVKGRACLAIDCNRKLRHAIEIRHESFIDPAFVKLLRKHRIALGRRGYGGQVAVRRGRDGRLHVPSPSRRRGDLRQRLFGRGARRVGTAHPRVAAWRRASGFEEDRHGARASC
jgi:uncharacterized protein YecE (DUF72 family)